MAVIKWRKKSLFRFCIIVITTIGFLFLLSIYISLQKMKCSDKESIEIVKQVCGLYNTNQVAGNLCPDLCSMTTATYIQCYNVASGKIVLLLDWKGRKTILKSKEKYLGDYNNLGYEDQASGKLILPSNDEFAVMVEQSIEMTLGFALHSKNILSELWSLDFHDFVRKLNSYGGEKVRKSALDSLWSLVQQEEYVIMQIFQSNSHVPKIYGTCGHFYFVEYVESGTFLSPGFWEIARLGDNGNWSSKAMLALRILDMHTAFWVELQQPLHLCDTKGSNLGVDHQGLVKVIDIDTGFFSDRLKRELQAVYDKCVRHADCDFWDCKGWCHVSNGTCSGWRTNNNLQVICEKIFLNHASNGYHGLLFRPPATVEKDLLSLLTQCASPPTPDLSWCGQSCSSAHDNNLRWKTNKNIGAKLYSLLQKTISQV